MVRLEDKDALVVRKSPNSTRLGWEAGQQEAGFGGSQAARRKRGSRRKADKGRGAHAVDVER